MVHSSSAAVEHPPARPAAAGGWAFFLGVVLFLVAGYLAYLVFSVGSGSFQTTDATRAKERQKILADRLAEDHKMLHDAPSWFAKDKGLVRVPIERAMAMTLGELSKIKPHAAYPISQSPPQPASALQSYGSLAPGKSMQAPAVLPTGARPAGSPPPAAALPAATPVPVLRDAAAAVSGSSPAPAPTLVAPPTPGPGPAANSVPAPAAAGTPAAPAPAPAASPAIPAASPTATP